MKRMFFKFNLLALALTVMTISSCNDDGESDAEETDVYNTEYSEVEVSVAKNDVEDAGIDLVNQVDALQNEEAVSVTAELITLMSNSGISASSFNVPVKAMQVVGTGSKLTPGVYSVLKSATEEGVALSDSFAAQCATYTYNFTTGEFDVTENSDAIQILFPGKSGDTSNTAELKVYDFSTKEITSSRSDIELPSGTLEFPTSLKGYLKYNDTDVLTYDFAASYSDEATPTSINNTLTIGDYSFSETLTHSSNEAADFDFSFKNGDDILIAYGLEVNGDWSVSNISNNISDENVEEIIQNGNAYIQIMSVKAVGKADIKTIVDGEEEFSSSYADTEWTDEIDEAAADNLVSLMSENASFVLVYVDDNSKIAWLEPYKVSDSYSYTWNGETYTYNDYYLDFRMVFSDDSKVSLESFAQDELTGFFTALEDFVGSIEG